MKTKYYEGFQKILDKHPIIKRSDPLSMNEVCYMLREEEEDSNISMPKNNNCWGCIPSVKHAFIPCSDLVLKVKSIEYDEKSTKDYGILCLTIQTY